MTTTEVRSNGSTSVRGRIATLLLTYAPTFAGGMVLIDLLLLGAAYRHYDEGPLTGALSSMSTQIFPYMLPGVLFVLMAVAMQSVEDKGMKFVVFTEIVRHIAAAFLGAVVFLYGLSATSVGVWGQGSNELRAFLGMPQYVMIGVSVVAFVLVPVANRVLALAKR